MTIGAMVWAFLPRPGRWGTSVVCSKSGTGCSVLEPKTCSLAANLLLQSCVPAL
jgi:hypothetical protein